MNQAVGRMAEDVMTSEFEAPDVACELIELRLAKRSGTENGIAGERVRNYKTRILFSHLLCDLEQSIIHYQQLDGNLDRLLFKGF